MNQIKPFANQLLIDVSIKKFIRASGTQDCLTEISKFIKQFWNINYKFICTPTPTCSANSRSCHIIHLTKFRVGVYEYSITQQPQQPIDRSINQTICQSITYLWLDFNFFSWNVDDKIEVMKFQKISNHSETGIFFSQSVNK